MIYLQAEPLYVISAEEIISGAILVAITMTIHGFGMLAVLRVNHNVKLRLSNKKNLISGLLPIIVASCLIILVHLSEVLVWALFFVGKNSFPNTSVAFYFSLNEYTTVGSTFYLPQRWRLLEGMIATAGLLAFAWSTGILITVAQEFQNQQMDIYKNRHLRKPPESSPNKKNHG